MAGSRSIDNTVFAKEKAVAEEVSAGFTETRSAAIPTSIKPLKSILINHLARDLLAYYMQSSISEHCRALFS